jgi:hypothetical protein
MIAVLLSAATCQLGGGGAFTLPDDRCTKGEQWAPVTQAQACDPAQHERQPVSATLRRQVLARYGYTPATFHGEIDHRIMVAFRGASTVRNLWPEPSKTLPNEKDRLEGYLFRRVCWRSPEPMKVDTAVAILKGNWVAAYAEYIGPVR